MHAKSWLLVAGVMVVAVAVYLVSVMESDEATSLVERRASSEDVVGAAANELTLAAELGERRDPSRSPRGEEDAVDPPSGLRGRVVSLADGRPIEGASISTFDELAALSGLLSEQGERAMTDASGAFRLALPVPPGFYVSAEADGYYRRNVQALQVPRGPSARPLDIVLAPTGTLDVLVLDHMGAPAPGAAVWCWVSTKVAGMASREVRPGGTTDALGHCTLTGLPCGTPLTVGQGEAHGWDGVEATIDLATRRGEVTVRVPRIGSISGRATWSDGEPASGVEAKWTGRVQPGASSSVRTGTDGTFRVQAVRAGRGDLRLDWRDGRSGRPSLLETRTLAMGAGAELDLGELRLERPVVLSGRVEAAGGLPGGVYVRFFRDGREAFEEWLSPDGDGAFSALVPPGPVWIAVTSGTARSDALPFPGEVLASVTATAPHDELRIQVAPLGSASVRVRTGDPDAPVSLELYPPDRAFESLPYPRRVTGTRDSDGAWRFDGILPGTWDAAFVARLEGDEGARSPGAWVEDLALEPGDRIDLGTLEFGFATLHGVAVDSLGAAVEGANVLITHSASIFITHEAEATTGPSGEFELAGLSPGWCQIFAELPGAGRTGNGLARIDPRAATPVSVTLVEASGVSGLVLRTEGPAAGVKVSMQALGKNRYWSAVTDAAGRFDVGAVPPDDYRLSIHNEESRLIPVMPGERVEVVFDLTALPREHLLVRDGAPVVELTKIALLDATSSEQSVAFGDVGAQGMFTLRADDQPGWLEARFAMGASECLLTRYPGAAAPREIPLLEGSLELVGLAQEPAPRAVLLEIEGASVRSSFFGELVLLSERQASGSVLYPSIPARSIVELRGVGPDEAELTKRIATTGLPRQAVSWP